MAEIRDKAEWNRTFAILAQMYNFAVPPGGSKIDPLDFYPWADARAESRSPEPTPAQEAALEKAFPVK